MNPATYKKALKQAVDDLEEAMRQRRELDQRLVKLKASVRTLASLTGENMILTDHRGKPTWFMAEDRTNLTDNIRAILRESNEPLTPLEVKDRLGKSFIDWASFSNRGAAIHAALKRLKGTGQAVVSKKQGRTAYSWKGPRYGASRSLANLLSDRDHDKESKG